MRICLVGPCSPHDLQQYLDDFDPTDYSEIEFYRGIPVSTLAVKLLQNGHDVEIITSAFGLINEKLVFNGLKLIITIVKSTESTKIRALTLFRSDRKNLSKILEESKADVYHAHWTYEFALAALSVRKNVLVSAHDAPMKILYFYRDPYRFLRFVMALIVRLRTNNLAAVSPYLAQNWRKQMRWHKQITILPNFTPIEMLEEKITLSRDKKTVLCISDSSKLKNVKSLVNAWKFVRAIHPEAKLRLVGNGLGIAEEIHQWAKLNELSEGIEWIGYVERSLVVQELNHATILCHPSLEESHSLVLVEALARGLPIVGGMHSGAVPWTLGDAGLLVDVKSKMEIAKAINELLLDLGLRTRLSELAQVRSREFFSEEDNLPNYIQAYNEILNHK